MNILYFYQYFSTSEGAWGTRAYEFAKKWVEDGHHVTVVTSVYAKSDLKSDRFLSRQSIDGIDVRVINILIDNRQSKLKRIATFVAYALCSAWYALTLPADVVIASSGPITVGIPGLVARWIRRRKLVFEARDLWPDGAIKMGLLRNRVAIRIAYALERACYRSSACVVGLSPGIQHDIQTRCPTCRVESVTNAANISLFATPQAPPPELEAGSYALYFGNIGEVNHSAYLLDAAKLLLERGRGDIRFVLIGEGQLKAALRERVDREQLTNVSFLNLMPKATLVSYVQHALASVVPLKPLPIFDTSSPNKLFESMAAGVPVIQTTQGWIKEFIERHQVGYTVDGHDPQALANTLVLLKDDSALARQTGERGREAAAKFFDKDELSEQMLAILQSVHHG